MIRWLAMEITMFLLVKESINQPLSKLLRSAPRRSLEAPIESAGGEVPNQWVKWGKYDIWFLPISPISMANGKCQIYWHIIFKSLGVFLGGVEGLLGIYGLLLGKKERSLWMGKYKKKRRRRTWWIRKSGLHRLSSTRLWSCRKILGLRLTYIPPVI